MKKHIILLLASCLYLSGMAQTRQKFSEEEFRSKKESFITKKAELTPEESAQFFPLYFELQDRKSDINNRTWEKGREGKDAGTTESEYDEIINVFLDARLQQDQADREYLKKFRKFLSNKKIYKIIRAEIIFNRNMLKIMQEQKDEK